jgi:hypothetical protein
MVFRTSPGFGWMLLREGVDLGHATLVKAKSGLQGLGGKEFAEGCIVAGGGPCYVLGQKFVER